MKGEKFAAAMKIFLVMLPTSILLFSADCLLLRKVFPGEDNTGMFTRTCELNGLYNSLQVGLDYRNNFSRSIHLGLIYVTIPLLVPHILHLIWGKVCKKHTNQTKSKDNDPSLKNLYTAHFYSTWSDRMWAISVPLIFMDIFKDTLLPTALYTAIIYSSIMVLQPLTGKLGDRSNRLSYQVGTICAENLSIMATSMILIYCAIFKTFDGFNLKTLDNTEGLIFFGLLCLCGVIGELGSNASTISLEKDWVVVLATNLDCPVKDINTKLRRIDLLCKTLAPVAFTAVYSTIEEEQSIRIIVSMSIILFWNAVSFPLEILYLQDVYNNFTSLSYKLHLHGNIRHTHEDGEKEHFHEIEELADGEVNFGEPGQNTSGILKYLKHDIFLISFATSMLWMTVVSNGSLMTAYLHYEKVSPVLFGVSFAVGALLGLLGTAIYPWLESRYGVELSAVISLTVFSVMIIPIGFLFSPLFEQTMTTNYLLLILTSLARPAMWSYDLAFTEISQKYINEADRGLIGGFQVANCQIFYLAIQTLAMIFDKAENFNILVMVSVSSVFLAALTCITWYIKSATRSTHYTKLGTQVQHDSEDVTG